MTAIHIESNIKLNSTAGDSHYFNNGNFLHFPAQWKERRVQWKFKLL